MEQSIEKTANGQHADFELEIVQRQDGNLRLPSDDCLVVIRGTRDNDKERVQTNTKWFRCKLIIAKSIWNIVYVICFTSYTVYLGFSMNYDVKGSIFLIVVFVLCILMVTKKTVSGYTLPLKKCSRMFSSFFIQKPKLMVAIKRFIMICLVIAFGVFLVRDMIGDPMKALSLCGLIAFIFVGYLASAHRNKILWRPVLWGLALQLSLGLAILRWPSGYTACRFIGSVMKNFLDHTNTGSRFIFGNQYTMHPIVFKGIRINNRTNGCVGIFSLLGDISSYVCIIILDTIVNEMSIFKTIRNLQPFDTRGFMILILPVIVYFSSVISVLYHFGIMQKIVRSMASVLQWTMQTTAIESLAASAYVFLGSAESAITWQPFLMKLTMSETYALLTGGFATMAGGVMAAYIEFGVPAEHIISASFMSAPAALAISKLMFPETEESKTKTQKDVFLPRGNHVNVFEAASVGAMNSIKLISFVIVNIIAYMAFIDFFDSVLGYMGSRVGYQGLNFQLISSYVFYPIVVLMGVPIVDCRNAARLLGTKIILNEFIAYKMLGEMIEDNQLQPRSIVIITYILCGFSHFMSIGITLGSFVAQAPERRRDFARLMLRCMIAGNFACFMTACIAGMLYQDLDSPFVRNGTAESNFTSFYLNKTTMTYRDANVSSMHLTHSGLKIRL